MPQVTIKAFHRRRVGYYSATARFARISGNTPVIRLANMEMEKGARHVLDWFTEALRDEIRVGRKPHTAYDLDRDFEVSLALPDLVSAWATDYHYTGGAHPNTNFAFYNVGLVNGRAKVLTVADLFRPGINGRKLVADAVYARLKKEPEATWIQNGDIKHGDPLLTKPFILTPKTMTFFFEPYAVGPYAAGMFTVILPHAEFGDAVDRNGPLKPILR
jgi:hypothetical protein